MYLRLGNTLSDGSATFTEVAFPEGTTLHEAVTVVVDLWPYHAARQETGEMVQAPNPEDPTGAPVEVPETVPASPRWVASDSSGLAALLAENFNCDVRELTL